MRGDWLLDSKTMNFKGDYLVTIVMPSVERRIVLGGGWFKMRNPGCGWANFAKILELRRRCWYLARGFRAVVNSVRGEGSLM